MKPRESTAGDKPYAMIEAGKEESEPNQRDQIKISKLNEVEIYFHIPFPRVFRPALYQQHSIRSVADGCDGAMRSSFS